MRYLIPAAYDINNVFDFVFAKCKWMLGRSEFRFEME